MNGGRKIRLLAICGGSAAAVVFLAGFFDILDTTPIHSAYWHPYNSVNSWWPSKQVFQSLQKDLQADRDKVDFATSTPGPSGGRQEAKDADAEAERMYKARVERLQEGCSNTNLVGNPAYMGNSLIVYFISQKYNFTYCKVPKTGCTFMTQTLAMLQNGIRDKNILSVRRSSVHSAGLQFVVKFNSPERMKSKTIMVTRNPFSRLLSAYLDKIYVPLFPTVVQKIYDQARLRSEAEGSVYNCTTAGTFEDFLLFVIGEVNKGKALDRHWAPIFRLCRPCEVNTYFIIKQESYSKDLSYFLKTLDLDSELFQIISEAMNSQRAVTSLPGILSVVYSGIHTGRKAEVVKCFGLENFHRRIWSALQMQGFIRQEIDFPTLEVRKNESDVESVQSLILEIVEQMPNSPEQSKAQRKNALVNAYASVSKQTIEAIRDIYKQDFELFGYSMNIPSED